MKYIVTGGAGYIGSHMVKLLQEHNHEVAVIDNFSTGNRDSIIDCEIKEIDIINKSAIESFLSKRNFDGVFHFAAKSIVSESFKFTEIYKKNNIDGTKNLIESMKTNNINKLIFSSSASVYGNNSNIPIKEKEKLNPCNPYGNTKVESENIINKFCNQGDIKAISFRYFNAAGAHPSGKIGENHNPETHLIPNLMKSVIDEKHRFKLFGGKENPTPDGTCIRDYIHVNDIVNAHYIGMQKISNLKPYNVYNIGSGKGYSILEIIKAIESVTKKKVKYIFSDERKNEPSSLVADITKIKKELKWSIKFDTIKKIIQTAWNWHNK